MLGGYISFYTRTNVEGSVYGFVIILNSIDHCRKSPGPPMFENGAVCVRGMGGGPDLSKYAIFNL